MKDKLYEVEKLIEGYYIKLAELEIDNNIDEYDYYLKELQDLINKEKHLLIHLSSSDKESIAKDLANYQDNPLIALGFSNNAFYYRLLNIIHYLSGDDLYSYEEALQYDINQITNRFLDYLITNPSYEEVRKKLIFYKYNLCFLNISTESDFLNSIYNKDINLKSINYKTDPLSSFTFVDNTKLVLECIDYLAYLAGMEDGIKYNTEEYGNILIMIISIITRLILCNKETLERVYGDYEDVLEDTCNDIKDIHNDMLQILNEIQSNIKR